MAECGSKPPEAIDMTQVFLRRPRVDADAPEVLTGKAAVQ
jgi:hypothetical protein